MQTPDRSGIICDYCGMSHSNDFIYYSFDFRGASCHNNHKPSLQLLHNLDVIGSYDICPSCFSSISKIVVNNNKNPTNNFICEITGKKLSGTFDYYYCVITKVKVQITGQPNICTQCQQKTFDTNVPCKCGNMNFVRPALINTIMRFLEFSLSEEAFQGFRNKAEQVRKNPAGWTTSTGD